MSKKKKRKETKKEKNNYSYELIGVLLILIALIGCVPNTGIAGSVIGSFAMFLVGCWYLIILIGLIVTGIYMIIKREKPEFFTSKLIGLYIIFIGILVLSHIKYIENPDLIGFQIIEETVNNFMSTTNRVNIGGGMIGAIFSALFTWLFSIKGTRIVTWGLIVCGIIMFTGMSIVDAVKSIASKIKIQRIKEKEKKDKKEIKAIEEHYENDNKKVISSVDDLIQKTPEETPVAEIKEEVKEVEEMDTKGYVYPSINLLNKPSKNKNSESKETINHNVDVLHQVFKDFGLEGRVVAINPGPAVTQYEMEIKSGTRLSKISSIHSEIALALAAKDVRIQAPIPGKSTIGIEIPNKVTSMVTVREILEQIPKSKADSKLMVTLGRDIMGRPQYCEINKTPHLLVAGSTGSGKSVCINSIIVSILMRANQMK